MKEIKFLKKGIKEDGKYVPVWYSKGNYTKESKIPKGTITIYARKYGDRLPKALKPENDSDMMTDYFEKDRARVTPKSKYYPKIMRFL